MTAPTNPQDPSHNLIWYASYGSNLSLERFTCYIAGGTAPGSLRSQPGARDTTPPRAIKPHLLNHPLYFAGESSFWTGGMGFIDHTQPGETRARAYLITRDQFVDIVTQENHLTQPVALDFDTALALGSSHVQPGSPYGLLLHTGHLDDYPVFTFTSQVARQPRTKPSAQYLATIARGLAESHDLTLADAHNYLAAFIATPKAQALTSLRN